MPDDEKAETPWAKQIGLRMELARIFSARSRHWMALNALQQVEQLKPEKPVPCSAQQAHALSEMGKHDQALEKLDETEALIHDLDGEKRDPETTNTPEPEKEEQPTSRDAQLLPLDITRASVLCEKGDYPEAEKILRRLLDTYPGNAQL
jgi:tetratricopeptide (TPR) repeat protein